MILIDSSVYIDWLRRRADLQVMLEPWIKARALAICGVIRAEVIRGVLHPRQKSRIKDLFDVLEEIPTDADLWLDAAELAWTLDRKGIILPLTDIIIAACARRVQATLITTDDHFAGIPGLTIRDDIPRIQ